jgi:hypothetical protein
MLKLFLFVAILITCINASAEDRCGGSEGPKPLDDVTTSFDSKAEYMGASGNIKEFFLWDELSTLIYRNILLECQFLNL